MSGKDSGWLDDTDVTNKAYTGTIYMRKVGNIVEVKGIIKLTTAITGTGGALIGILPEHYRPTKNSDATDNNSLVSVFVANPNYGFTMMTISPGGGMRLYKPVGASEWDTTHNTYLSAMFFADDE